MPTFEDLVGHERVVATLRRQLERDRLAHAYWVTGPEQVGKTTLARALAQACLGTGERPGALDAHPDFWVDDEDGPLQVDRIRGGESGPLGPSLQHVLALTPFAGGRRVVLIANCERLTDVAANSVLRLLEEPPPGTVLLLTTARPQHEHLPPTLPSRCQPLALGLVPSEAIAAWLRTRPDVAPEAVEPAAALADGRPGRALALAVAPDRAAMAGDRVAQLVAAAGAGPDGWLALAAELGADAQLAREATRSWAAFLRDASRIAAGAGELARWVRVREAATAWAAVLGLSGCLDRLEDCGETLARLAAAANPRLALDRLLLRLLGGAPAPPILAPAVAGVG